MKSINSKIYILIVASLIIFNSCNSNESNPIKDDDNSFDYFNHFNHLYKEIDFHNKKVGIVHIYSQYPNYEYAIEPNEGFTCVDDVSRAIVLLSKHIKKHPTDKKTIDKVKKLTEFVLEMQNENGYFNNFIWNDLSINTTYKTSVAELNWWSFRALWGLEHAYVILQSDVEIANRITMSTQKLIENIKRDLPINDLKTELINGIETPTWLPQQHASDQAAVLILGLLKYYKRTNDSQVYSIVNAMAQGIMIMQKGDANNYPYGAFLSWENLWHAWGNNQAYALLKAGQQLNKPLYIESALKEIDVFYPYLIENGFAEAFWIKKNDDNSYAEITRNKYPQIAYGLRPMVLAASEAYQITNDVKYSNLALSLDTWFYGNNDANSAIFDPLTGICFDGIVSSSEINKNSGAESTIESLMVFLEIEDLK